MLVCVTAFMVIFIFGMNLNCYNYTLYFEHKVLIPLSACPWGYNVIMTI